ncbi:ketoacyl-synthetase C-terminal extension domain-containing protein [Streptomyces sp. B21-106]|uniref:ketoacyl-synthetase C-terminal extension domain-containing protein n=1 Tax=Streptomyces sp. B21-106 TaxID=3039418 RepID=UPI003FA7997F
MIEALRAGVLPATPNVSRPTHHIDWEHSGLALLTRARPWERGDGPRRAGVSSFGISGTNAHLVIEEAEPEPVREPAADATAPLLWSVSAPHADSLRAQARALADHVGRTPQDAPEDVAHTLRGRSGFRQRGVVIADSRADLLAGLESLASDAPLPAVPGRYRSPTVLRTESYRDLAGPVFVFPGRGPSGAGWVSR